MAAQRRFSYSFRIHESSRVTLLNGRLLLLLPLLLAAGCQTLQPRVARTPPIPATTPTAQADIERPSPAPEPPLVEPEKAPEAPPTKTTAPSPAVPADLWEALSAGFALDAEDHSRVENEIQRYLRFSDDLARQLARGEPYLPHILEEIRRRGLPTELALLPCIESGFRPTAHSHRGAAGLWQFMPRTGRALGLEQDWWYDARRDPILSTRAALDYLEKLHARFGGDWLLALAAYNAGQAKVLRAIRENERHGRPTDFWSLRLPRETRVYVPRLLALARIIATPDHFGIDLPEIGIEPRYATVEIQGQLDLKVAAKLAGMKPEELLRLNPGFNRWATHPHRRHQLLLPMDRVESFRQRLAELPPKARLRLERYRIRPGDTLSEIAQRYGLSVKALMAANGLRSHRIRAGKVLMIPLSGRSTGLAEATPVARSGFRYKVRKGDSLYVIARRFGVKIRDLKRWNRLASNLIRPGQTLTIRSL